MDAWAWGHSKDGTDHKGCLDTWGFYMCQNFKIVFIFVKIVQKF